MPDPATESSSQLNPVFCAIAKHKAVEFVAEASKKTAEEVLTDWLCQVHRNAEIARNKHVWVHKAMYASFIAAPFWIGAVLLLVEV